MQPGVGGGSWAHCTVVQGLLLVASGLCVLCLVNPAAAVLGNYFGAFMQEVQRLRGSEVRRYRPKIGHSLGRPNRQRLDQEDLAVEM